jgi:hypothetical protein
VIEAASSRCGALATSPPASRCADATARRSSRMPLLRHAGRRWALRARTGGGGRPRPARTFRISPRCEGPPDRRPSARPSAALRLERVQYGAERGRVTLRILERALGAGAIKHRVCRLAATSDDANAPPLGLHDKRPGAAPGGRAVNAAEIDRGRHSRMGRQMNQSGPAKTVTGCTCANARQPGAEKLAQHRPFAEMGRDVVCRADPVPGLDGAWAVDPATPR